MARDDQFRINIFVLSFSLFLFSFYFLFLHPTLLVNVTFDRKFLYVSIFPWGRGEIIADGWTQFQWIMEEGNNIIRY